MPNSLAVGASGESLLCRVLQILDCPPRISPFDEMYRQFRRHLPRVRAVSLLQPDADPLMEARSSGRQNARIQRLAVQVVSESIPRRDGAVWPIDGPAESEKLAELRQTVAPGFHVLIRSFGRGCHGSD